MDKKISNIFLEKDKIIVDKLKKHWYNYYCWSHRKNGEMSERFKEPVLKTGDVRASVGSNPTLSSTLF